MAQQDVSEVKVDESAADVSATNYNIISYDIVYALKSVSSGNYLDGRDGSNKNPLLANRSPKDDKYLSWKFVSAGDGYYGIYPLSSTDYYLDGRDGQDNPYMTKDDLSSNKCLRWSVELLEDNKITLKGVQSGFYLDGREGQDNPYMSNRDPTDDTHLQWTLVPLNYTLYATIDDYDYGDQADIDKLLEASKSVAASSKQIIRAEELGLTLSYVFSERNDDSYTWGNTQTVGTGVQVEATCGVPLVGGVTTTVSSTFETSANQEWSTIKIQQFEVGYDFTPQETGVYEVGMLVYVAENVQMPYTATATFVGKDEDGTKLAGTEIDCLLFYYGANVTVTKVNAYDCVANITGNMSASYAVETETYNTRTGDL